MDIEGVTITEVVGTVTVHSPRGRCVEMRDRRCFGLSFCADGGRITYRMGGVDYVEDQGHAVLLPKGKSYTLHGDADGVFYVVNFETLAPLCETVEVLPTEGAPLLLSYYEELRALLEHGGRRTKILALVYEMLAELSPREGDEVIASALQYLSAHYCDPALTNRVLAARANISEVYFRRRFKAQLGVSPKQYVLSLRLRKAKRLLAEGWQSITGVAEACGFEDIAHFSRVFKGRYGLTPSEYRKKHNAGAI